MAYTPIPSPYDGGYDTTLISSGASLGAELALGGRIPIAIIMPGAWTAGNLTFQGALLNGASYTDVYDDAGSEYTVAAAAARWILLSPVAFRSFAFIKIRSGTSGTPVVQGADRTLQVVMVNMA